MHLLLDSSGSRLVCALADSEHIITTIEHVTGSTDSRNIGAVADEVLGDVRPPELTAIIVGTGPGSFIGTRVAISYANGLAGAGDVPLCGVDSLAAIIAVHDEGHTVALRDARRSEVYFHDQSEGTSRLVPLRALADELLACKVSCVIWEEPVERTKGSVVSEQVRETAAHAGARLVTCLGVPAEGLRLIGLHADPVEYIEPVYLRGFT